MPYVFLSPSTQEWNRYYTDGNEELYMNRLADMMEPYLRSSGINFSRNDPDRNISGGIADSNAGRYDVHLPLHSNAGGGEFAGNRWKKKPRPFPQQFLRKCHEQKPLPHLWNSATTTIHLTKRGSNAPSGLSQRCLCSHSAITSGYRLSSRGKSTTAL